MLTKRNLAIISLNLCSLVIFSASSSNLNQQITKQFTPLQGVYTITKTPLNAQAIELIEKNIGYTFKRKSRLMKALTTEEANPLKNMEIYEYMGDVILKKAQMEMVHKKFPKATPGERTTIKQAIESLAPLCALGVRLELHNYIQHINPEIKSSVVEDAMEALIWAIHKDGGPQASEAFMTRFFYPMIANHKVMPINPSTIIRHAHPNKCLHYKAVENTANNLKCNLQIIDKPNKLLSREGFKKSNDKKNNPKPKIAEYNACYQYVLNNLSAEQQQQLISWPLSDDYLEYNDTLDLNIDWKKCLEDPHLRLHNLCAKLKVDLGFQEQENNDGFMSTVEVGAPFNITQNENGKNKKEARKKAAQKILAIMQQRIVLHPQLHALNMLNLAQTLVEDMSSHKAMLNRVCEKYNLEQPQIKTCVQENLISEPVAYITSVKAPWLIKPFETNAYSTLKESQRAAHKLILKKMIEYLKQAHNNTCDLKKLALLKYAQDEQLNQNKTKKQLLNELKEKGNLNIIYYDYRVADANHLQKIRSNIAFDKQMIEGNSKTTLEKARENAATKALQPLIANLKIALLDPPKPQLKNKKNRKRMNSKTTNLLSSNYSSSSTCPQSLLSTSIKMDTTQCANKKSNTKEKLNQRIEKVVQNNTQKKTTQKQGVTTKSTNKKPVSKKRSTQSTKKVVQNRSQKKTTQKQTVTAKNTNKKPMNQKRAIQTKNKTVQKRSQKKTTNRKNLSRGNKK